MQIFFFSFHCFYTGLVPRRIRTKYLALTSLLMNLIFCFFLQILSCFLFYRSVSMAHYYKIIKIGPPFSTSRGEAQASDLCLLSLHSALGLFAILLSVIQILISLTKLFPCISQIMKNVTATSTSRYFLVLENINLHCFYVYQLSNI